MGIIRTALAIAADNSFGPQFLNYFDLTLLFQHSIFTILPSALLILACPAYMYHHGRKAVVADAGAQLWAKLAIALLLVGIEIFAAVSWSHQKLYRNDTAVLAAAFLCIGYAGLGILLFIEHRHTFRPSGLLAMFLILTIVFDGTKVRTHFTRTGLTVIGSLSIASMVLKAALVVLGEVSKRPLIRDKNTRNNVTPEVTSGFWGRALFVWLNKTFLTGFKTFLHNKDLPELEPEFKAEYLLHYFGSKWTHANHADRNALLKLSFSAFWTAHASVVFPRLLFSAFNFCQPFIIQATVHKLAGNKADDYIRAWLVVALFASFFGRAIARGLSNHFVNRCAVQVRGALNAQLLQKSLKLTYKDAQEVAAASLMSADVEAVLNSIRAFHATWSGLLDLGVGFYLLALIVKQSAFLAAVPSLLAFLITIRVGIKMVSARREWSEATQKRISGTTKFLSQLKGIKITGRSQIMLDYISGLRRLEIDRSVRSRKFWVIVHTITTLGEDSIPTALIAGGLFWSGFTDGFNAASVFSMLSVVVIIVEPLGMVPSIVPNFSGAVACSRRIQEFLLLEEQHDRRIIGNYRGSATSSSCEKGEKGEDNGHGLLLPSHIKLVQEAFPNDCAVALQNVTLKYGDNLPAILEDASMAIAKGDLGLVAGPTACGKSSFLQSIIGEMEPATGSVYVHDPSIAFCSQNPFIENKPLRKFIIGDQPFDLAWYRKVIRSCCLEEELAKLPNGDQGLPGSRGDQLSGGQKQRMALAALAYSKAKIMVLDDPFSAVDFQTARAIFANLFAKETGILRQINSTIIMATQTAEFFEEGDQILVLNGQGCLQTCKSIAEFAELSLSIPNMDMVKDDVDDEQRDDIPSSTSSHTSKPWQVEGNVSLPSNDLDSLDYASRKSGDSESYAFLFRTLPLSASIVYTVFMVLACFLNKFLEIYVRIWIDRAPGDKAYFVGLPCLLVIYFVFHTAWYWQYYSAVVPTLAVNMHEKLLHTIIRADLTFITSKDSGTMLNRFSQDMTFVNAQLQSSMLPSTSIPVAILLSLGIIAAGASYTAVIIPFFFAVLYAIMFFYLKTSRQIRHLDLESQTPLYTHFTETTAGIRHIRSMGRQHEYLRAGLEKLDTSQKPYYYMMTIQRWLALVLDLVVVVIAVVLESFALYVKSGRSQSGTGLALVNLIGFAQLLQAGVISWTGFETSIGVVARLNSLMRTTPIEDDPSPPDSLPPNWPTNGELQMSNVALSYSTIDNMATPVLEEVSCSLFPGARVALEGRTGSGKSSFILSILNLINRTGDMKIDGIDPKDVPPDLLRSRITTISQDPVKLHGTVRNNLIPPGLCELTHTTSITDDEVIDILRELCIWDFIRANGGLDIQYEDIGFSDGQQQLVALAAAVIHHRIMGTRLVIIDEATSHLDYATDDVVQAYLETAFSGSTVICVTHRRNGFPRPDYSLRFVGGELDTVFCHTSRAIEVTNQHDAKRNKEKLEQMGAFCENIEDLLKGDRRVVFKPHVADLTSSDANTELDCDGMERYLSGGAAEEQRARQVRASFKRKRKQPHHPTSNQSTVTSIPIGLTDYGVKWNDPPPADMTDSDEMMLPIGISLDDLPPESRRLHSPNSGDFPDDREQLPYATYGQECLDDLEQLPKTVHIQECSEVVEQPAELRDLYSSRLDDYPGDLEQPTQTAHVREYRIDPESLRESRYLHSPSGDYTKAFEKLAQMTLTPRLGIFPEDLEQLPQTTSVDSSKPRSRPEDLELLPQTTYDASPQSRSPSKDVDVLPQTTYVPSPKSRSPREDLKQLPPTKSARSRKSSSPAEDLEVLPQTTYVPSPKSTSPREDLKQLPRTKSVRNPKPSSLPKDLQQLPQTTYVPSPTLGHYSDGGQMTDEQTGQQAESPKFAGLDERTRFPPTRIPVTKGRLLSPERSSDQPPIVQRSNMANVPDTVRSTFQDSLNRIREETEPVSERTSRVQTPHPPLQPLPSSTDSSPRVRPGAFGDDREHSGHSSGESSSGQRQKAEAEQTPHIASLAMGPLPSAARIDPRTDKYYKRRREPILFSDETRMRQEEERLEIISGLKATESYVERLREEARELRAEYDEQLRDRAYFEQQRNNWAKERSRARFSIREYGKERAREQSALDEQEMVVAQANTKHNEAVGHLRELDGMIERFPSADMMPDWEKTRKKLLATVRETADKANEAKKALDGFKQAVEACDSKMQSLTRSMNTAAQNQSEQQYQVDWMERHESKFRARWWKAQEALDEWEPVLKDWRNAYEEWDLKYNHPKEWANLDIQRAIAKNSGTSMPLGGRKDKGKGKEVERKDNGKGKEIARAPELESASGLSPGRGQEQGHGGHQYGQHAPAHKRGMVASTQALDAGEYETDRDSDGCTIFDLSG